MATAAVPTPIAPPPVIIQSGAAATKSSGIPWGLFITLGVIGLVIYGVWHAFYSTTDFLSGGMFSFLFTGHSNGGIFGFVGNGVGSLVGGLATNENSEST